jgi:hypothetical protein
VDVLLADSNQLPRAKAGHEKPGTDPLFTNQAAIEFSPAILAFHV